VWETPYGKYVPLKGVGVRNFLGDAMSLVHIFEIQSVLVYNKGNVEGYQSTWL